MRRRLRLLAFLAGVCLTLAAACGADAQIADLRARQAAALEALAERYGERAQGLDRGSPAYRDLLAQYSRDAAAIRRDMKANDPRAVELARILSENPDIANTGSVPKDVNADVDLAASTEAAADRLTEQWRAQYGAENIQVFGHKIINHATDTTLWRPDTPERLPLKLTDADAFYAEGGRKATGVVDAVRNEVGWALSNYQKFAHAHAHGDQPDNLQVIGKSLSKVYEGNNGWSRAVAASRGGAAQTPEVIAQATMLRNYGDVYQAGIADLGDSPEEVRRKTDAWKAQAADAFATEELAALERAQLQEQVQQSLADSVSDPDTRAAIQERLDRSRRSNRELLARLREVRTEAGLETGQSAHVEAARARVAAHVGGAGPERVPTPPAEAVDIRRPTQIVSDEVRFGGEPPQGEMARVFNAYDKAKLAFDPVGALTELATAAPNGPPPGRFVAGAGALLNVLNVALNYQQVWQEAEAGDNANITFNADDSETVRRMKAAGAALLETSGAPGFMRDLGEAVAAEFDQNDPDASTLEKATMATGRVLAKSAEAAIIKPLQDTLLAGVELGGAAVAGVGEMRANAQASAQAGAVTDARQAARQRELAFNLMPLRGWIGAPGGDLLLGSATDGQMLSFTADRSPAWTEDFLMEWSVLRNGSPAGVAPAKSASAASADAGAYQVTVRDWPAGEYAVALVARGADGRIHARETFPFSTGLTKGEIGLGSLDGWLDKVGGPALTGPVERGRTLAFTVVRQGKWGEGQTIEWSVDGDTFQNLPGADPRANVLIFGSDRAPGADGFNLSVRILDATSGRILAHKEAPVEFASPPGPFTITAAMDEVGGPPLTGPVPNGVTLAFSSEVPLPAASGGSAPISELLWQVYDRRGEPVPGLAKREQISASGPRPTSFRFRPDRLANGAYRIILTHVVQGGSGRSKEAQARFEIFQPVRLTDIVVTDRPNGTPTELGTGQTPHIYVHYAVADSVPVVRADMKVTSGGATLYETSVDRPLNGDPAAQRVGVALSGVTVRGDVEFTVTLTPLNGRPVSASRPFALRDFKASISLAGIFVSGESAPYSIKTPPVFEGPLDVSIQASGLTVTRTGPTRGFVEGTNFSSNRFKDVSLEVTVRDAVGRVARGRWAGSIERKAKPEPVPVPPKPVYAEASKPPYTPPEPQPQPKPAGIDLSGPLATFNAEMNRLRQQKRESMERIEKRYSNAMSSPSQTNSYGGSSGGGSVGCRVQVLMHNRAGMGGRSPLGESAETRLGCLQGSHRREAVSVCGYQLFVGSRIKFQNLVSEARGRGANEFQIRQVKPGSSMWDEVASCPIS